jgi:hypothetical protein
MAKTRRQLQLEKAQAPPARSFELTLELSDVRIRRRVLRRQDPLKDCAGRSTDPHKDLSGISERSSVRSSAWSAGLRRVAP